MDISACSLLFWQEPVQVEACLAPTPTFRCQRGRSEHSWSTPGSFNHPPEVPVRTYKSSGCNIQTRLDKYLGKSFTKGSLLPTTALLLVLKTCSSN